MSTVLSMTLTLSLALGGLAILSAVGASTPTRWGIIPALILVMFAVWAMGSFATALSTRLAVAGNLTLCFIIFMCGLMSDYLFGRFAGENWVAGILYAAVPNWQLFWMADALAAGKHIPGSYLLLGGGYVVLLVGFFTLLGVILFMDREVGEQRVS